MADHGWSDLLNVGGFKTADDMTGNYEAECNDGIPWIGNKLSEITANISAIGRIKGFVCLFLQFGIPLGMEVTDGIAAGHRFVIKRHTGDHIYKGIRAAVFASGEILGVAALVNSDRLDV